MAAHLDSISGEARKIELTRTALTVFAAVFFGIGWVVYHIAAWSWLIVAWVMAAVKVGWQSAKVSSRPKPPPVPQELVMRENAELREMIQAQRNIIDSLNTGKTVRA